MSRILEQLYLGSYANAQNKNFLNTKKITHIVTLGAELKATYPTDYKYLYIPALDKEDYDLKSYFTQITEFISNAIEQENGKVFVHCHYGISRSATAVISYLIKCHRMNFNKAYNFVRGRRAIISPNPGFIEQLKEYAEECGVFEGNKNLKKTKIKKNLSTSKRSVESNVEKPSEIFLKNDDKERDNDNEEFCISEKNIFIGLFQKLMSGISRGIFGVKQFGNFKENNGFYALYDKYQHCINYLKARNR